MSTPRTFSAALLALSLAGCAPSCEVRDPALTSPTAGPDARALTLARRTPDLANLCARLDPGRSSPATADTQSALCEAVHRDTERVLSNAPPQERPSPALLASLRRCVPSGTGAWSLELTGLAPSGGGNVDATLSLVHVSADGVRSSVSPALGEDGVTRSADGGMHLRWGPQGGATAALEGAPDLDGDGEREVLLRAGAAEEPGPAGSLWSFREGTPQLYPGTAGLLVARILDADADGSPDVLTASPYADARLHGPPLLLHALAGGYFSTTDNVARAAARCACPTRPAPADAAVSPPADNARELLRGLVCARLWGAPPEAVLAPLRSLCALTPTASACASRSLFERWSALPAPLQLR